MEEPKTHQTSRECFNDDPALLMGLPPLEKISEFWKRYDNLADIYDKKLTSNLNENLDVLLIFAALFSAINTAFISLSMSGLSPNPSDETNALLRLIALKADNNTIASTDLSPLFSPSSDSVIVNCLLYASLSCSLLTAVGAMKAKEWLHSFDRTGQTDPLEEQGQFRQRTFNGVQQWHLESAIQSLPNLLLTIVHLLIVSPSRSVLRTFSTIRHPSSAASTLGRPASPTSIRSPPDKVGMRKQVVAAQAAGWLLGTTSNRGDQIAAAQFICTLDHTACTLAFDESTNWRHLVSSTRQAFDVWHSQPSDRNQEIVELFGLASCHVLVRSSRGTGNFKSVSGLPLHQSSSFIKTFLWALDLALANYCIISTLENVRGKFQKRHRNDAKVEIIQYSPQVPKDEEGIFYVSLLSTIISRGSVIRDLRWTKISRFFLLDNTGYIADALLMMWAITFCHIGFGNTCFYRSYAPKTLVEAGESEKVLIEHLSAALFWSGEAMVSVRGDLESELSAMRGYTACMRRLGDLSLRLPRTERDQMSCNFAHFILSHIDPLTSSAVEKPLESVRLSANSVLALRAVIITNPPQQMHFSRNLPPKQPFNGHLIDAVVDIIFELDDIENLTTPKLSPRILALRGARDRVQKLAEKLDQSMAHLPRDNAFGMSLQEAMDLHSLICAAGFLNDVLEGDQRTDLVWTLVGGPFARIPAPELEKLARVRELVRELAWGLPLARVRLVDPALRLPIGSCIIRILLWVWECTSDSQLDESEKDEIFISSCRLWAPLEKEVGISTTERFHPDFHPLMSNDLNKVVEFTDYIRTLKAKSAFIARNADVGINRLYSHLDQRIDWVYELFDLHNRCAPCCRSNHIEDGMM
ncbi:hypothetical protein M407DRAFT_30022 [Tulasnella calospora MUT 4182]|uniref:DUF6535 domain-containing protein n=1 Tax=Tulasnella calospora MUT 4182 TaxID=1051891 RepID=A0A0C3LFX7_9AGAM|nr:hypothetical protein M407DRAFT_30022 [Tulasnella calospora MUT 4182]